MAAIDGLGSGLNTSSIINQLMQIERLPQTRLEQKRLHALAQGDAWQRIDSALKAVHTTASRPASTGSTSGTSGATIAATSVKDLVTALNTALTTLTASTGTDAASRRGGPLRGDTQARALTSTLVDAVTTATTSTTGTATLGGIGIRLERTGTYTFDEATFTAAMAADPAGTTALVTALGTGLTAVAKQATTSIAATATSPAAIAVTQQGQDFAASRAAGLQKQVDGFQRRLELTEARLRRQFTELDKALGLLRTQGSWLTGQINSLQNI